MGHFTWLQLIVMMSLIVHNYTVIHAQKLDVMNSKSLVLEVMKNKQLRKHNTTTSATDLCGPIRSLEVIQDREKATSLLHSNIAIGERTALFFDRQDGSWGIPFAWDVFIHERSEIRFSLARNCLDQPHLALKVYINATGELLGTELLAMSDKYIKHGGGDFPVICSVSSEKLRSILLDKHTVRIDMMLHVRNFKKDISIPVSGYPKARSHHKLVTGTVLSMDTMPNRLVTFLIHHMSLGFTHFYFFATFSLKVMPNEMRKHLNEFAAKNPDTITITQWFAFFVPATYNLEGLSHSQLGVINTLIYRLRAKTFSTWIAHIDSDEFLTPNRNLSAYVRANEGKTNNIPFQQSYFYLNPAGTNKPNRSAIIHGDGNFTYSILNGSAIVSEGCERNYHLVSRNKNLFNANEVKLMAIHFPEGIVAHDKRYVNGLQCFLHFAPTSSYRNDSNTRFDSIEKKNIFSSLGALMAADKVVDTLKLKSPLQPRRASHGHRDFE